MEFKKVSVIGLGYIGLPTAAMFASRKIEVIGVDVNQATVDTINRGKIHIVEPDLDIVVHSAVTEGYLKATLTPQSADAFIIAVPTPFTEGYKPDLSFIESAAKMIAPVLEKGNLVILESTSPVGATEKLARWLAGVRTDLNVAGQCEGNIDISVAHCPERVLPGHVMRELIENDRIVGGITSDCSQRAIALYKTFVQAECITTNARTAEMSKLTENSFRDVNIAFANELSMICDEQNIDVWELIALANRHPRVNILQPGCGVGGHCIAVDPWFIVDSAPETSKLIKSARQVNDYKPCWGVRKILDTAEKQAVDSVICFGLAFKPDIDDLRESPALGITHSLARTELEVLVVEPNITELPNELVELGCRLIPFDSLSDYPHSLKVMLVAHSQFKHNKADIVMERDTSVIDLCGVFTR